MLKGLEKWNYLAWVVFVCRGTRDSNRQRDSFGKRGAQSPGGFGKEGKKHCNCPFRHRLSCGTNLVPLLPAAAGERRVIKRSG